MRYVFLILLLLFFVPQQAFALERFFDVQSVDTMKYSRDRARSEADNASFDKVIDTEVKNIKAVGATHVAIGTPYDEEFIPYMHRWVSAARRSQLNVWFRGNFAGWEQWFDYPVMTREEHTRATVSFIKKNPELFEDGDIFVSCPECENGGPGDPRMTQDVESYRTFLIDENKKVEDAFASIGKKVDTTYYSMNADVARLVMDPDTTKQLGHKVVIDHYIKNPEQLATDVASIAQNSGGNVVLGEFGAPIPDIHGTMTEKEQADWIERALKQLISQHVLTGINYWTYTSSSTELWRENGEPKLAVINLTKYFKPTVVSGQIIDTYELPVEGATVTTKYATVKSDDGTYEIPILGRENITVTKDGYRSTTFAVDTDEHVFTYDVTLKKISDNWLNKIVSSFLSIFFGKK